MNIFKKIGQAIMKCLYFILFELIVIFAYPFMHIKRKGKDNIKKDDEARVFISNHLEIYGPSVIYLHLPVRKKSYWVIDRMLDKEQVSAQMHAGIDKEENYKWAPKWLKNFAVKVLKNFLVYVLKSRVRGISVSRDNQRQLIKTFQASVSVLEKKRNLCIFPEVSYQEKGIGEIFTSFAVFGRYYYKKTGKKISYYPVYLDKANKVMNIAPPIVYDPQDDESIDKIVEYVRSSINDFSESAPLSKKELKQAKKKQKNEGKIKENEIESKNIESEYNDSEEQLQQEA